MQPERGQPPQQKNTPLAKISKSSVTSAEKTTLKTFAKGRKPVVKESPKLFKAPAGDQKAENRLGRIKQTLRRQNALGRNTSKTRRRLAREWKRCFSSSSDDGSRKR